MQKVLQAILTEAKRLELSLRMQEERGKKLDPWDQFKSQQESYYTKQVQSGIDKLHALKGEFEQRLDIREEYQQLLRALSTLPETPDKRRASHQIQELAYQLQPKHHSLPSLPAPIQDEVEADVHEMQRCFDHGLYRSAVILCGRVLETCLHRKYYETTQNDLLEKAPGIGLGKLIAKLKETETPFPPGITEQIHLINKARITSVHTKQEPFIPTRDQAHAIILYTMDAVKKLF